MLEFIYKNYYIFIIIAIVLLFGLIGYFLDRRKFEKYRDQILRGRNLGNNDLTSNNNINNSNIPNAPISQNVQPNMGVPSAPLPQNQNVNMVNNSEININNGQ